MASYQSSSQIETFTPAQLAESEAPTIYAAVATVSIIATFAVALRFLSRAYSKVKLSWDDYTILVSLIFLYGLNVTIILQASLYGLGRHVPAIKPEDFVSQQKADLAILMLYFTCCACIKTSLILLYYRYFGISRSFRIALYICSGIIFSWYSSVFLVAVFQCIPLSAFWDHDIKSRRCVNLVAFSLASGITNLLTDFLILCLPIPMVWSLHSSRAQKWTLTGIFSLGFFVCAISIVRCIGLVHIKHYSDFTWTSIDAYIWSSTEPSIGILSACLPTMRPLFGRFFKLGSSNITTTKAVTGTKKSTTRSSTFDAAPLTPDWEFIRLDEEAAMTTCRGRICPSERGDRVGDRSSGQCEQSNLSIDSSTDLKPAAGAYEMEDLENKRGPRAVTRGHERSSIGRLR